MGSGPADVQQTYTWDAQASTPETATTARRTIQQTWSQKLGRYIYVTKRQIGPQQAPPAQPAIPETPITVKIVAAWQAPIEGGQEGRRYAANELSEGSLRLVPHSYVNVKPWTGSKKRDVVQPSNIETTENQKSAAVAGREAAKVANLKAFAQGQACCANAVWFD